MPIDLSHYERSTPPAGGDATRSELEARLERLQLSQIAHGGRAMILVEGWEGSGRRAALRRLAGTFDPCHLSVHCPATSDERADGRHWLAPYWSRLPAAGRTAAFLRGWYGDLIDRRANGEIGDKEWARAFDEINEFEAQQTDHGTPIVKLFLHISEEEQARRLHERSQDPWLRWTLESSGARSLTARKAHAEAFGGMFKRSNTRWAGWTVIAAGDEEAGQLAALEAIAGVLAKSVPAEPPKARTDLGLAAG